MLKTTTGIGSSEYTKHNKCLKTTCSHIIVELQKIREGKILEGSQRGKTSYLQKNKDKN